MRMNFGEVLKIEDLGNHAAATVISLGILLAGTVSVLPDAKRKGFYEVEGGSTAYYIYVSPVSRTIFLLAAWDNLAPPTGRDIPESVAHRLWETLSSFGDALPGR